MALIAAALNPIKRNDLNIIGEPLDSQLSVVNLASFDELWDLPHEFVEPANIRRSGWSGVSILRLQQRNGEFRSYFLKRQENQKRYSLRYLSGAPTFQFEADALQMAMVEGWPCVELGAFGARIHPSNGVSQAVLLTPKVELPSFADCAESVNNWSDYLPQLRRVGQQLLALHCRGWQHGALFPAHLFIDLNTGQICLIDLERARKRLNPPRAAYSDLVQFFRRCDWLPEDAITALLDAHVKVMPTLIGKLNRRFPDRFNVN